MHLTELRFVIYQEYTSLLIYIHKEYINQENMIYIYQEYTSLLGLLIIREYLEYLTLKIVLNLSNIFLVQYSNKV